MSAPIRRRSPGLVACGWLAACSAPPAFTPPELDLVLPDAWVAGDTVPGAGPGSQPWWREFGSRDVERIVAEALRRNHDLRAAAARVERAVAQARVAGADLLPRVSAEFEASRDRQIFLGFPFGGEQTTTRLRTGLALTWELDLWGRLRATERAALADVQAAEADLAAAYLSLSAQAAKAWFAVTEADLQAALAEDSAASYRATARLVRDRVATGLAAQLELRLAEANVAAAEALAAGRRAARAREVRRLEVLLGRYPAGALAVAADLPDVGAPVPAGLPADLVARRPDVGAAERRAAAALARGDAARASLYPRISLTASGGLTSTDLKDLLDGDSRIWSLAGNLLQPIFEGGRLRAAVTAADAAQREALEDYATAALNAYAEVEAALAVDGLLRDRARHLTDAVAASRDGRQLAEDRYRQGVEAFATVLEAQRRELDNQSLLLAVRRARLDNRVDLHLALGGGFDAPPDATTTDS